MSDNQEPPPPRCPRHLDQPTEAACGACGKARQERALWEALNRDDDDESETDQ